MGALKGSHNSIATEFKKGRISPDKGRILTEEEKSIIAQKTKEGMVRVMQDPEKRVRILEGLAKGRLKGRPACGNYFKKGHKPLYWGKPHTEESKHKMSEFQLRRFQDPEERRKNKDRNIIRSQKPEERRKSSERAKLMFQNPELIKKISDAHKDKYPSEYYREMGLKGITKQQTHHTSIEMIVYQELKNRGILFEEQHIINGKFLVDVYIPSLNLVIECDGDYWHSLDVVQKRDKAKNAYLTKCGFNLLRLPEYRIRNGEYLKQLEEVKSG